MKIISNAIFRCIVGWKEQDVRLYAWYVKHQPHCLLHAQLLQSRLTLCNPMGCSPPGSSVQGILQARILEWVAMCSSRGSSWPGREPTSFMPPALAGGFFTTHAT